MKILVLTRYGHLGASSRIRFLQYLPWLENAGFEFSISPLLSDEQLKKRYSEGAYGFSSLLKAYWRRIRTLMQVRRFDMAWIQKEALPWFPAWLERWMLYKVPYVLDYDDATFHNYDRHPSAWVRFLYGRRIDHLMRDARLVVTGNECLAHRARTSGAPLVEIVPSVIDLFRYSVRRDLRPSPHVLRIVWIGSPSTVSYFALLRNSLAELSQQFTYELWIIGGNKIDLPGVDVKYREWAEDSEVSLIQACDIGVMPLLDSPWERGKCGFKLIQYMACGKPVVASPVGINTQLVEQGVNGYLAESSQEWVQALAALMADADLRQRMGAAGRAKVEHDYTIQVNAPRLVAMLRTAAGKI